ncbi:hypothetical protein MLD38_028615 [Melastoma candidum]|uniref:Uncharacterized protein n=1 Tax=Melastoma candidum TaxID=119954 RepID=A0ACB9N3B3_9MYRT|nr:hypothetical protein MLD38_028615 [Melastoma candidum]
MKETANEEVELVGNWLEENKGRRLLRTKEEREEDFRDVMLNITEEGQPSRLDADIVIMYPFVGEYMENPPGQPSRADPDEFLPERFLTNHKHIEMKDQNLELILFGAGRRVNPGLTYLKATPLEVVLTPPLGPELYEI